MASMTSTEVSAAAIRFDDVSFSYEDSPIIQHASFHLHKGSFAALVGPNGAGKTTALRLILGLIKPQAGKVSIFGRPPETARGKIGYVPQQVLYDPAFPISALRVVGMGRLRGAGLRFSAEDKAAVERAMRTAGVLEVANRPYAELSGGQRRRVLVARALAAEPELLILDEPTANMDAQSESRLFDALGSVKGKATVLIVTHDSGFVSALTDVVFCVGDRGAGGSIVRHKAKPAEHVSAQLYGGPALEVLHDTELPMDACCGGVKDGQ